MTWKEVFAWGWIILVPLCLILHLLQQRRHNKRIEAYLDKQMAEEDRRAAAKPSSNPRLSLPPASPTSPTSWLVAPAMVLAAATMLGAAVFHYHTEEGPNVSTNYAGAAFRKMAHGSLDYAAAKELLLKAETCGENPILIARGMVACSRGLKDYQLSEEWIARLARMPGEYAGSLNHRGLILTDQGRTDEARKAFLDAAQLGDGDAVVNLGAIGG